MPTRPIMPALVLAAVLGLAAAPALAVPAPAFAEAMALFQRASAGDNAAIEAAAARCLELSSAEPADAVLRAYAGAATSLRAKTVLLPWRKMSFVDDGLALIDKALAQLTPAHDAPLHRGVPASLETRFIAASTFLDLPAMFNRAPRGTKLLDEVAQSPLLDGAPLGFRATVWLRAGIEAAKAKRTDEARHWLHKVTASGAPQAAAARTQLQGL